jgi:uncharacterized repeat protein (TIGR03806 family)
MISKSKGYFLRSVLLLFVCFLSSFLVKNKEEKVVLNKLSDYGFFVGNIADQIPVKSIIPYSLNTPLFSDNAIKLRFVKVPEGQAVTYNAENVFAFPIGTVIIKTFYFPNDFRDTSKGRNLMETRLLIHEKNGWKALDYVWNEAQTDAILEVAGDSKMVEYLDENGKKQSHQYIIPNQNQCKGCHNNKEVLTPIGPSARQLNGNFAYNDGAENQLINWAKRGILKELPALENCPKTPVWNKPETGTLAERARAYLDINCAHCHNPNGPAMTSGLNLTYNETNETAIGINKSPVAAGRGSGGLKVDIQKGKPDKSIIIYRMQSTDPGIAMPEVGRQLVHNEGVALVKDWIKALK